MKSEKISVFLMASILVMASFCIFGCLGDDDDNEDDNGDNNTTDNNTTETSPREYRGSMACGDIMTLIVCENNHTIWYDNFHTGESGWVNYTENPDGTYNVTAPDGEIYKAVEMAGYAIIAYIPGGGENSSLVVGLNITTATEADLVGNYTFLSQNPPDETDYGMVEGYGNGTLKVNVSSDYRNNESFNVQLTSNGDGTFNCSGGGTENWTAFLLPNNVLMFDRGEDSGFVVGVKRPDSNLSGADLAGDWKLLNHEGNEGDCTIYQNISGFYVDYLWADGDNGTAPMIQDPEVHGLFTVNIDTNDEVKLIVLPGKMIIWVDYKRDGYGFALYQEP